MSSDSFALFRRNASTDMQKLADEHMQHDLTANDRALLQSASSTLSTHVLVGSLVGLSLGAFLALRVRQRRLRMFEVFKAKEKPTFVKFADGREEAIPDVTPLLKPTPLGDLATYGFFSIAGIFLGGEVGILTGAGSAKRSITSDPETKARLEKAFRSFKADVLRRELKELEGGTGSEKSWMGF